MDQGGAGHASRAELAGLQSVARAVGPSEGHARAVHPALGTPVRLAHADTDAHADADQVPGDADPDGLAVAVGFPVGAVAVASRADTGSGRLAGEAVAVISAATPTPWRPLN